MSPKMLKPQVKLLGCISHIWQTPQEEEHSHYDLNLGQLHNNCSKLLIDCDQLDLKTSYN